MAEEYARLQQEVMFLRHENATLRRVVQRLVRNESQLRERIVWLMNSHRYRIGSMVADATLPVRRFLNVGTRHASSANRLAGWFRRWLAATAARSRVEPAAGGTRLSSFVLPPLPAWDADTAPVAGVLRPETLTTLRYTLPVLALTPDGGVERLIAAQPRFVLVEEAFLQEDEAWHGALQALVASGSGPLQAVLTACRQAGIATLLWVSEPADGPEAGGLVVAGRAFSHVLVAEPTLLPGWQGCQGPDRVHLLLPAIQPQLHNPLRWPGLPQWDVGHEQRGPMADPAVFTSCLQPLPAALPERLTALRGCRVVWLAAARPDTAQTALEALGCGTPVVVGPAADPDPAGLLVSTLREGLASAAPPADVPDASADPFPLDYGSTLVGCRRQIQRLLDDGLLRERIAHRGWRLVHRQHTWKQRLAGLHATLGLAWEEAAAGRISIIACTHRPQNLETLLRQVAVQCWSDRELILVLHGDSFDLPAVRQQVAVHLPGLPTQILHRPRSETLGDCLNAGIRQSRGDFWAKMDDDDLYGPHYLADALLTLQISQADVVGKHSFFAYVQSTDTLYLRHPGHTHQEDRFVAGGTLLARRTAWERVKFVSRTGGGDTVWLRHCAEAGMKIVSGDCYNYILIRHADSRQHTWTISPQDFLASCDYVASGLDLSQAMV